MFGLFNKKLQLVAPVAGKVIALEHVPDPVFSQRAVGDGVAMDEIAGDTICAPVDGILELIFHTNHAFAIKTKDEVEVLVHIGINTVGLNGRGFARLAEQGQSVKAGTPIIRIDRKVILDEGLSLATPVLITSPGKVEDLSGKIGNMVSVGDVILECKRR